MNGVMPARLRPMLCARADVVPEGPEWVLERKCDGYRLVVERALNSKVRVYAGRNGSDYTGTLPYIEEAIALALPPASALDGELCGESFGDVQAVMKGAGAHRPTAALPALRYVVFDLTRLAGEDLRGCPWSERRERLEGLAVGPLPVMIGGVYPATQAEHDRLVNDGAEGSVCKRRDSVYVNDRSNAWLKVKHTLTEEAEVIGFRAGKRAGRVGSLRLRMLSSGAETSAAGFDAALAQEMGRSPERWLGTVVEIKHNGLSAEGVPRHPRYVRRRDDRTPEAAPVRTKKPRMKERRMVKPTRRNYGAMGDEKLLKVIRELETGGDAAERAKAKGFRVEDDLELARQIAEDRDLLREAA